ncbi:MAG: glycosyl transferase [Candidatus Tectimicrobiota bacterium]|nr:MAG: glycosyl transferase [Candidatus Tectomicrobia bacterium]
MTQDAEDTVAVSIVIPAYEEEQAIGGVIEAVQAAMAPTGYRYEILVVDDGSRDQTAARAQAKGVRVYRHRYNLGSGAARKTGILQARGEIVVMIDADGTYPADAIPRLLAHFPEADQVVGARTSEQGTHRWLRAFAKTVIRRLAAYLVGQPIPDLNSGLRAFKRAVMLRYLYLLPDGFSCVSTMSLAFLANRHVVVYEPIAYFARIGRSKFHPIKDTYQYLLTVIRVATYFNPLQVFLPVSLGLIGFGLLKSLLDLVLTATIQESDIIAILSGVVVAAIGILADLIITQGKRDHESLR